MWRLEVFQENIYLFRIEIGNRQGIEKSQNRLILEFDMVDR